jgi:hypothetical protein
MAPGLTISRKEKKERRKGRRAKGGEGNGKTRSDVIHASICTLERRKKKRAGKTCLDVLNAE